MSHACTDLTIDSVLTDPVIGAAMRADRVDPRDLEMLLRASARRLEHDRPPSSALHGVLSRLRRSSCEAAAAW